MRLLRLRWILLSLLSGVASGCGFSFQSASEVLDQRVLAIQLEPPELAAGAADTLAARALLVDPRTTADISYEYRLCLSASTASGGGGTGGGGGPFGGGSSVQRCPDNVPIVARGVIAPGELSTPLQLPASVVASLGLTLADAGMAPPGDGGTPRGQTPQTLSIDFRTNDNGVARYAVASIPLTLSFPPGDRANENPHLAGVTFDGHDWTEASPITVQRGTCTQAQTTSEPGGGTANACQHKLAPVYDAMVSETFHAADGSGGWTARRERLSFSWFTTKGSISPAVTSQRNPGDTTNDEQLKATWSEPADGTGIITFWIVIRDGRGGSDWIQRSIVLQ